MKTLIQERNAASLKALAYANYRPYLKDRELQVISDSVVPGPVSANPNASGDRTVRGDFLRWLLNDARAIALFDKDGLQVASATIDGEVDLDSSHIPVDMTFLDCEFTGDFTCVWASLQSVFFLGGKCEKDLSFEGAAINGKVILNQRFECEGTATFSSARIAGEVDITASHFQGVRQQVVFDGADLRNSLKMADCIFHSEVSLDGAKIGNELDSSRAQFLNKFSMTGATISGDVTFEKTLAAKEFRLDRSKFGGSILFLCSELRNKPRSLSIENAVVAGDVKIAGDEVPSGDGKQLEVLSAAGSISLADTIVKQNLHLSDCRIGELDCKGAQIGTFTWQAMHEPEKTSLLLERTIIKKFVDVRDSWPSKPNLKVSGLTYESIDLEVPKSKSDLDRKGTWKGTGIKPDDRIEWLQLQPDDDMADTQPWMQLAQYVQAKGNTNGSKQVIYKLNRIRARSSIFPLQMLSWTYDIIEEYPLRVFVPILLFWIFGSVVFWRARRMNAMAPTDKDAFSVFNTENGDEGAHYVPFSAVVYALENVLPVVKLGQDSTWAPNPQVKSTREGKLKRWLPDFSYGWLALLRWALIVLGWVLALILGGAIGAQFKA